MNATNDPMSDFRKARRRLDAAEKEMRRVHDRTFPDGVRVYWRHGRHVRSGLVNLRGMGMRVRVITDNNTEYWIDSYRVTARSR